MPGASADPEEREARSYDFGRMAQRIPDAVAAPGSAQEVSDIVVRAARDGVPLAIRGGGHSQGGQALADTGMVIDMGRLDGVELLGEELVRAQGGALWGKVVDSLHGTRLLPAVLVDVAEVTVGGTLSAGGIGTTSHRHGMQVGQVEQLEVVTGTGEIVLCSRARNADLFDAVRGGQGQFGVITDAWIRLRKTRERTRMYELGYRDVDRLVRDLGRVLDEDRFDHVRLETRSHAQLMVLHAGVEYDGDLDDGQALEGLEHEEMSIFHDTDEVGRAAMFSKFGFSRLNHHPWRDWLMPWDSLRTMLVQEWLDPQWLPRWPLSFTGGYPCEAEDIGAPLFMHPGGGRMLGYSILPVTGSLNKARMLAGKLAELDRTFVELGGKAYLSGGTGYGRGEWEEHYGDRFETGLAWKKKFDPEHLFGGDGAPFRSGKAVR